MAIKSVVDTESEILQRVIRLEQLLADRLTQLEKQLARSRNFFEIFNDGIQAYRQELLKETNLSAGRRVRNAWSDRIRTDRDLRVPHRKIMEFLLDQYDFQRNAFTEVHFSRLVKEARVGKNMAREYLNLLDAKGYVQRRHDGYRLFFKIHE